MQNDPNPIVLYLIVKKSLNMSSGKTAAQVGHCVQSIILHYIKIGLLIHSKKVSEAVILPEKEISDYHLTTEWMHQASRKVVLKADDNEFEKIKIEYKDCIVIKDAGLTEIAPGSETCVALRPLRKNDCSKLLKRLQAL